VPETRISDLANALHGNPDPARYLVRCRFRKEEGSQDSSLARRDQRQCTIHRLDAVRGFSGFSRRGPRIRKLDRQGLGRCLGQPKQSSYLRLGKRREFGDFRNGRLATKGLIKVVCDRLSCADALAKASGKWVPSAQFIKDGSSDFARELASRFGRKILQTGTDGGQHPYCTQILRGSGERQKIWFGRACGDRGTRLQHQ